MFVIITIVLYLTIGFVELPLMLESLTLAAGAINQDKQLLPVNYAAFFDNSACYVNGQQVVGACTQAALNLGCLTMSTFLPIFDPKTPDAPPSGGSIIQTCYFDHGKFLFADLDKSAMDSGTGSKAEWLITGCAKPCLSGAPCNNLNTDETKLKTPNTLSLQRLSMHHRAPCP